MRLLVIGINYAPEAAGNAPYTTGFAEHMAAIGHEVHVLTGMPHYPEWQRRACDEADGERNGVFVHRREHYVPSKQSAVRRAMYEGSFLMSGRDLRSLPRPDAIVSVVPILSDGVLGVAASNRFDAPLGVIFQDLMGQAAKQSEVAGGGTVGGLVRAGEGWVARRASSVAIVADAFRPYIESLGVDPQSIVRVSNWNPIPAPLACRQETRSRLDWPEDAFVCLHAGNMGHKQGLANLIESARIAEESRPELIFIVAGNGNQRADLEARASRLSNVRFLPTQSNEEYANLLQAADALILHQAAGVTDMSFPSKTAAYVASGTPILAAVAPEGAVGRELNEAGAAVVVEPGEPQALLDAIVRVQEDELLRWRLARACESYSRRFDREPALRGLESFVARIAGREVVTAAREPMLEHAA